MQTQSGDTQRANTNAGADHPHTASRPVVASASALDALLSAEDDASRRLQQARDEAAAIMAAARRDAEERTASAAARQELEIARAEAEHRLAIAEIERTVTQSAEDLLARYHGLGPAQVRQVAATVLVELTGLSARDAP